jgi:manganese transport protein
VLNNRSAYLGADKPTGRRALLYNGAMVLCIAVVLASVTFSTLVKLGMW